MDLLINLECKSSACDNDNTEIAGCMSKVGHALIRGDGRPRVPD